MTIDLLRRLVGAAPAVRLNGLLGRTSTPAGTWEKSKLWLTNDLVLIYADEAGQPTLVASAEIVGYEQPRNEHDEPMNLYRVETVNGELWEFTPMGNCGCGSSLSGFSPFPPPNRKGT